MLSKQHVRFEKSLREKRGGNMDSLENIQMTMQNRCNKLGKLLHGLFWLYIIITLILLTLWGVCALITPETFFSTEQYGNAAKVGFHTGQKGLYVFVTNTSFSMNGYSSKKLYGILWGITWGYQILYGTILWCLSSLFHYIKSEGSPFTLLCSRQIRRIGFLLLCIFIYKNIFEAAVLFIWGPATARTALVSDLQPAFIGGLVLCLSYIFEYGIVLQQQSDETL